ncbi:MAG TPA: hypothetical protein VL974_07195 [Magnetospirillum sp.]|jgi:hypothetical protein|nr:hypothetical protein [Magnetospirillum sp.]
MPLGLPRRSLAVEIAASLALKALALAAIGLLLFGPDSHPQPSPPPLLPGAQP